MVRKKHSCTTSLVYLSHPFPHTTILQQTTLNIFCQKIQLLYFHFQRFSLFLSRCFLSRLLQNCWMWERVYWNFIQWNSTSQMRSSNCHVTLMIRRWSNSKPTRYTRTSSWRKYVIYPTYLLKPQQDFVHWEKV